jgi:RNA polymerase sigma-70 factor (ECF subfamily)
MSQQDWLLMHRVGNGDEEAVAELYDRFGPLVYKVSRQLLPNQAEADDAVQEVFVRLWKTADRYNPHRAKLVTWVMLITRRHLIDRLRRSAVRPDTVAFDGDHAAEGKHTKPDGLSQEDERNEKLLQRIADLPELQRVVIERAYLKGYCASVRRQTRRFDEEDNDQRPYQKNQRDLPGLWGPRGNGSETMTSSEPMSREELLAMAALDAYGLLDHYEAELYTRSFHHASAGVQDEVRSLQAEISGDASTLPEEMPPPQLRQKVLEAVARAIEQEDARLVIAKIGGRRDDREMPKPQRTSLLASWFGSSSQFWRAAAFALMGAVIAMAYHWNETKNHANKTAILAIEMVSTDEIDKLQRHLNMPSLSGVMVSPDSDRVKLDSMTTQGTEKGTILIDESQAMCFLLFDRLPPVNGMYELSVTDKDGKTHSIQTFAGSVGLSAITFSVAGLGLDAATWTVSGPGGHAVLQSQSA